jgi:hypothetical protein
MFVQIYPDSACSPMHRDFARAYGAALDAVRPLAKPAASATRRAGVAASAAA